MNQLKILVFDQDSSLRQLLLTYLTHRGHEVLAFCDPTVCPLYLNLLDDQCRCPKERPCADAVLIDYGTPKINALEFLKLQRQRGCKILDANKAIMSASMTRRREATIAEFGCHHIGKPFRLARIGEWLEGCHQRLAAQR